MTTATDTSTDTSTDTRLRSVMQVLPSISTLEGGGFTVRRPFPVGGLEQIDPFLLLDHMGPVDYSPGQAKGAPDHPHRGFQTVTYLLEGEMEHEDSVGNRGALRSGDVQWMTAGAGVVHSEMPSRRLQTEGGRLHGFQIWVNLPQADKMVPPRYQEVPSSQIPVVTLDDGKVTARLVAGTAFGREGAVETHTPIEYFHLTVCPGGSVEVPSPEAMNAMVYAITGSGRVAGTTDASESQLVVLERDGDAFTIDVPADADEPFDVLVLAGQPLGEPVARYGPFVMNTRAELAQAVDDFNSGRLGSITR
jgi:redox-sensitive bicupin YhaK (pirin superfamily)